MLTDTRPTVLVTSKGASDLGRMIRPFLGKIRFVQTGGVPVRGCYRVESSEVGRPVAEIGDAHESSAPFIDALKLDYSEAAEELAKYLPSKDDYPTIMEMVNSFSGDMVQWAAAKFARSTRAEINQRLDICRACDYMDKEALHGSGRCKKCGCSIWAKVRLKSSKCPVGKWAEIPVEAEENTDKL